MKSTGRTNVFNGDITVMEFTLFTNLNSKYFHQNIFYN